MQIIIAFVCLSLLMWVEPASAQRSLTVGRHEKVSISDRQVDDILIEASKVLRRCNVVLQRKGPVGTFTSPNPEAIVGKNYKKGDTNSEREAARERDAVHRENFDVKIVKAINFCRVGGEQAGCSWDPLPGKDKPQRKSIIVATEVFTVPLSNADAGGTWAHEFGHRMGLPHRPPKNALMYACDIKGRQISDQECRCFRQGCDLDPGPPAGGDLCNVP
jgi:hypothetical protein